MSALVEKISATQWDLKDTIGLLLLGSTFLYFLRFFLLPKPLLGIPYNPEAVQSLLGDVPAMIRAGGGIADWLLSQARLSNGPLHQVFIKPFARPYVLISDFNLAREVMMHRKEWDRADFTIDLLSTHAPYHQINLKANQAWKTQRRQFQSLMTQDFLHGVVAPNVYAGTLDLVELWATKEHVVGGRPFSAELDIFHSSLDAVLEFSFGSSFPHRAIPPQASYVQGLTPDRVKTSTAGAAEFDHQPVHETIEATLHATYVVGDLIEIPYGHLLWWFQSKLPSESRRIRLRHAYIKEQVFEAVRRMNTETDWHDESTWVGSAVDMMMQRERLTAEREGRKPVYWSPAIRDEVFGFVIGGHDTSSTTALWGLKFLSDSQEVQDKLRHALRDTHAVAVDEGRMPTAQEITSTQVPYLEAVIEEMSRLGHTIPMLERQATCDTELLGHRIPKGTTAIMMTLGPSITEPGITAEYETGSASAPGGQKRGARPPWDHTGMAEFRPERWLTADEQGQQVFNATAGPTMPFGMGVRGCAGKKLARLQLRITFTLLVWRFRLARCAPELSGYGAVQTLTHKPAQCYVKLERLDG
ncbi:hypothetical protein ACO1O0_006670 [Amphichorda felina]